MRATGLIAVLVVLFTPAHSWAQTSLGEVARKEQERRKTIKGESRLITNKDLPNVPPATAPSSAPSGLTAAAPAADSTNGDPDAPAADADATASDTAEEAPRGRAYWSQRMAELREALTRNQTFAEALQSRINALTTDFTNRDDPFQRAAIGADRDRAVAELERLRKQLVADERAIKDLQEEARRANVPAGWLR